MLVKAYYVNVFADDVLYSFASSGILSRSRLFLSHPYLEQYTENSLHLLHENWRLSLLFLLEHDNFLNCNMVWMQLFWHLLCENFSLYFCKRNDVACNFLYRWVMHPSVNYTHVLYWNLYYSFHIDITLNDKVVVS